MKTKSGKHHFECDVVVTFFSGRQRKEHMKFVAFDGINHMENVRKRYAGNAEVMYFEYYNIVDLDDEE